MAKIKAALGTNPSITLTQRRHFLTDSVDTTQDKIKGVIFQKGVIVITLKKAGQFKIENGEEFSLDKGNKKISLGSNWTVMKA